MPSLRRIPSLVYGTAWKKEHSRDLVRQAIHAGFRAVDTAAQPKHYSEELVGAGIRDAVAECSLRREDLWIQTKFTPVAGQDLRHIPYDATASIQDQVKTSVASSLGNLSTGEPTSQLQNSDESYLDALLLHSPFAEPEQTLIAWRTLAQYAPNRIRYLGISNVSLPQLQHLYSSTNIKPSVVQNPFHAGAGYDAQLRAFCREKGITYQSFWTLTANSHLLQGTIVQELAAKASVTPEVSLYALVALGLDIRVLNGTTKQARMLDDLAGIEHVRGWRAANGHEWMTLVSGFKGSLSRGRIL